MPVIDNVELLASKRSGHGTGLWSMEAFYNVHFTSVEVDEDHEWSEAFELRERDVPPDSDERLASSRTHVFRPDGRFALRRSLALQMQEDSLRTGAGGENNLELYVRIILRDASHPGS